MQRKGNEKEEQVSKGNGKASEWKWKEKAKGERKCKGKEKEEKIKEKENESKRRAGSSKQLSKAERKENAIKGATQNQAQKIYRSPNKHFGFAFPFNCHPFDFCSLFFSNQECRKRKGQRRKGKRREEKKKGKKEESE